MWKLGFIFCPSILLDTCWFWIIFWTFGTYSATLNCMYRIPCRCVARMMCLYSVFISCVVSALSLSRSLPPREADSQCASLCWDRRVALTWVSFQSGSAITLKIWGTNVSFQLPSGSLPGGLGCMFSVLPSLSISSLTHSLTLSLSLSLYLPQFLSSSCSFTFVLVPSLWHSLSLPPSLALFCSLLSVYLSSPLLALSLSLSLSLSLCLFLSPDIFMLCDMSPSSREE